jgi:hypothetical protein
MKSSKVSPDDQCTQKYKCYANRFAKIGVEEKDKAKTRPPSETEKDLAALLKKREEQDRLLWKKSETK